MSTDLRHISVCVCTYRRPHYLARLLRELGRQETGGLFTFSIVVADNDVLRSAEPVVAEFSAASAIPIRYCVQPERSVPLTRSASVENAAGDYVAFIDDDEFPDPRWLLTSLEAIDRYRCAGVLGPVAPYFEHAAPRWVIAGRFYERPPQTTGVAIDWKSGRTGNALVQRSLFVPGEPAFRPQFQGGGADLDFFRRMMEKGHVFVWCNEALVHEVVPPVRCQRSFMLRKALLRGWAARFHPSVGIRDAARSVAAVAAYAIALPFALFMGHHRVMALLIKSCDHLGKLFALVGIRLVKQPYVTE